MARKSKSTSRRRYKAPARRKRAAPVKRSTKSSAIKRRGRRRKNPKGILATPAVRFGIAATVGAGLSTAINARKDLQFMRKDGGKGEGISGSYAAAALTFAVSAFLLKGRNKNLGFAFATGMLLPAVAEPLGNAVNKLLPVKSSSATFETKSTKDIIAGPRRYVPRAMPSAKFSAVQQTTSRMKSA